MHQRFPSFIRRNDKCLLCCCSFPKIHLNVYVTFACNRTSTMYDVCVYVVYVWRSYEIYHQEIAPFCISGRKRIRAYCLLLVFRFVLLHWFTLSSPEGRRNVGISALNCFQFGRFWAYVEDCWTYRVRFSVRRASCSNCHKWAAYQLRLVLLAVCNWLWDLEGGLIDERQLCMHFFVCQNWLVFCQYK